MIKIGSLFAGIGGFERGIEAAIEGAETIWQVEREPFCQKVLRKHWPNSKIYNDVRDITRENVEPVDMLIGGFPCQDISLAGKGEGLNGKKSGLWWEMHRIIRELRPRIVVMENVSAITIRGGLDVLGSLASIGYDAEWRIIAARDFGAPHRRDRWFCVAWPSSDSTSDRRNLCRKENTKSPPISKEKPPFNESKNGQENPIRDNRNSYVSQESTDSISSLCKSISERTKQMEKTDISKRRSGQNERIHEGNYWKRYEAPPPLCRVDDGIPDRIHRLKALGNAIVPQCSEYVGRMILKSGLLS